MGPYRSSLPAPQGGQGRASRSSQAAPARMRASRPPRAKPSAATPSASASRVCAPPTTRYVRATRAVTSPRSRAGSGRRRGHSAAPDLRRERQVGCCAGVRSGGVRRVSADGGVYACSACPGRSSAAVAASPSRRSGRRARRCRGLEVPVRAFRAAASPSARRPRTLPAPCTHSPHLGRLLSTGGTA